jgi:type VI secretion system ImpA family protein
MDGGDMAPLIDIEAILAPISSEEPCGVDLRYEGTHDAIRDARREDDATLPQGVWESTLKRADWGQVRDIAVEALSHRSKDLQIAVWLAEALTVQHGFAGAAVGIQCITALCGQYWDGLFPPKDEDAELRIAPLEWLNDKLPARLSRLVLTDPTSGEPQGLTWQQWQKAQRLEALASSNPESFAAAESEGDFTVSGFLATVSLTRIDFYRAASRDLAALAVNIASLSALLDDVAGGDAPSFAGLREQTAAMHNWVQGVLRDRGEPGILAVDEAEADDDAAADEAGSLAADGVIRSRDQAYRRLDEIADYLLRSEPHSPTPYLLKRAVAWGNMSLNQLLKELIAGDGDRKQLFKLLGMPD